jgi:hypothetical protein
MISYILTVSGLGLNFISAVLLLKYSPASLSAGGTTVTQQWERPTRAFGSFVRRSHLALWLLFLGFLFQLTGYLAQGNAYFETITIDAQMFFTGIIALATVAYTVGTIWLWKSTRNLLRLNILVGLRQERIIDSPIQFERLVRDTLPEARELISSITAEGVREGLKER